MKISICIITYNHQQYIAQTLDAVLQQQYNFDAEIIIGEDLSTDDTRKICADYAAKHPEKIKLLPAEKNLGMMHNFLRTYKACSGKYIAFCEGDDYWTDPFKLQKQVDFLEANPGYSACFHNVIIKNERKDEQWEWIMHEKGLPKDSFDTIDVLGPWFIASPSFMFVNYPDFVLPDWYFNCSYGDLPFMLLLSLRGNFKYLDDVMAVYRLHDTGMTTVHKAYDKIMVMVYIYASFDIYTKYKYHEAIRKAVIYEVDRHSSPQIAAAPKQKQSLIASVKKYLTR